MREEQDGKPNIARLFAAAAHAETVHAHAHLRVMGGIRDTGANLKEAIAGEHHEFVAMYPEFLAAAEAEGNQAAATSFRFALAVEKVHHDLYREALAALEAGRDLPQREVFVCAVCGNTVYDAAPDQCPVCRAKKEHFQRIA